MIRAGILAVVAAVWAFPASASGGAHVVDDAAVEIVGTCHLESWVSRTGRQGVLVNSAPACTFRILPRIEFGGVLQREWLRGEDARTLAGPSIKLLLAAPSHGPSLALVGTAAIDTRAGGVATASIIAPVTFTLSGRTRLNLNAGWTRTGRRDAVFYGAQIEHAVSETLAVMMEAYRLGGATGVQSGLRWTPKPGRIDVDLLVARETNLPPRLTFGLTVRT